MSSKSLESSPKVPLYHRLLQFFAHWLFSIYHDIRVEGAEHVPRSGAAIIAANHPTYLDAAFLMIAVERPIRFMAWEKPFNLPVLGPMMRVYGAIPVDMKKPGRASFEAAVKVLRRGELFGIFPEGGRSKQDRMNPFKSGVARLALITGAKIIPATILGGRRVWKRGRFFPRPGPIHVVYHPPIRLPEGERAKWRRDKEREAGVISAIIDKINDRLIPAARRDARIARIYKRSPQNPSPMVEGIPIAYLLLSMAALPWEVWQGLCAPTVVYIGAYIVLLGLELILEARGWWVKWVRHVLPWLTLVGIVHQMVGMPPAPYFAAELALGGGLVWCTIFRFPLYRRVRSLLLAVAYGTWLLQVLSWGIQ